MPDFPQDGWCEISVEKVWAEFVQVVSAVAADAPEPVGAMCVAVMGEAVIPVGRVGEALAPCIMPVDRRAERICRELQEQISPLEIMRITGTPMGPSYALPYILWLKKNEPDLYRKTWKFMGWQDYLVSRLGLEPVMDESLAGRTQMFDLINRMWSDSVIDVVGFDRAKLSDVRSAGSMLGSISRNAAEELGLAEGTKLVLGGYDQAVAALGVGVIASENAMVSTEGTGYLITALDGPVVDAGMMKNAFACTPHVVPNAYVSVTFNSSGMLLLNWVRELLRIDGDGLDAIMSEMDDRSTDLVVLPYFGDPVTPHIESQALGSIVGLSLNTGRGTLVRGLLEGMGLDMKFKIELLRESEIRIRFLNVTGPAADSGSWCQLRADTLGIPLQPCAGVDAGARGAAMLAGIGTREYRDVGSAVDHFVSDRQVIRPNGDLSDLYTRRLAKYRKLYAAIREVLS